jgi:hypothetical protein
VIDVSAHGVDWRQRAEPRKYVRAANIPGMDDGIAAGKCRERLRPQQAMSIGIAPMVRIMPDRKGPPRRPRKKTRCVPAAATRPLRAAPFTYHSLAVSRLCGPPRPLSNSAPRLPWLLYLAPPASSRSRRARQCQKRGRALASALACGSLVTSNVKVKRRSSAESKASCGAQIS